MTLGERIRALRIKQNLSQEDLAAALEVSRQSVSKWETDASTPDLDKLVKLSEVFHITLDELVRGETLKQTAAPSPERTRLPTRMVVGIALLCAAFISFWGFVLLSGSLVDGLLAAPLALCGVLCLLVKRRPGLVCAWVLSVLGDGFVAVGMRCAWRIVLRSITRLWLAYFDAGWKYFDFGMMLLQLAWLVFLLVWTVRCLKPHIPILDRRTLTGGWLLLVLLHTPWFLGGRYMLLLLLADWLRIALLAVLLACTPSKRHQS